jgi:antitoxin PrlF
MASSTLTSKGQVTVPKEIRDGLKLKTGQTLEFRLTGDGQVLVSPRTRTATALKGIVKARPGQHVSIQQMNETIAGGYAGIGKGRT